MGSSQCLDITLPLGRGTAVFPGDPSVLLQRFARLGAAGFNGSALRLSVHTGTHVDAPLHVADAGADAASLPLDALVGPVRVLDCTRTRTITAEHLAAAGRLPPRLLLQTGGGADLAAGGLGRGHLSPAAATALAAGGVLLVGLESLSVDPPDNRELPAHRILLGAGIVVLEGVDLRRAEPGDYELVCLPLPLVGADGAPARTLLRPASPVSAGRAPRCT